MFHSETFCFALPSAEATVLEMLDKGSLPPRTGIAKAFGEAGTILILCLSILAPGFTLAANWPQIRTETATLAVFLGVYGWALLAGVVKPIRLHAFYLLGILFSLSVIISMAYGTLILKHELILADFFEIPKCWLPVLFFSLAYEAELSEKGLSRLLDYLAGAIALVCLYGWAQFLNLRIASRLNPYYTDFGHNYGGLIRYQRIFSTMANPNALAQLMSWALIVYTLAFLFGPGNQARNVCVSLMCLVTLALTSSRYGLLASGLGLLLVIGLAVAARRRLVKLAAFAVLLGAFGCVFAGAESASYWAAFRFEELRNPLQVSSLRGRLDYLWVDAADYIESSPWVGHGPAKKLFFDVYTDSEYLDVLKFYGAIGFLAYLAYYFWPLRECSRALRALRATSNELQNRLTANLLVLRAGLVIFCMALFMNIGEFTFYNAFLLAFLWLWGGLAVRAAHFIVEVDAQSKVPGA